MRLADGPRGRADGCYEVTIDTKGVKDMTNLKMTLV